MKGISIKISGMVKEYYIYLMEIFLKANFSREFLMEMENIKYQKQINFSKVNGNMELIVKNEY